MRKTCPVRNLHHLTYDSYNWKPVCNHYDHFEPLTPLLIGARDSVVEDEAEGHGEEHAAGQDHCQDVVQGGVTSPGDPP